MTPRSPIPRRLQGVVHELEATGETVIFDEAGRRLLVLNAVGAIVWYLIDGRRSLDEIAGIVAEGVALPRERIATDALGFLRELEQHALVDFVAPAA
ncbi:MAG: PqqD family protein [Proteobacteria bacterium]|nr:PqqD family protein [Pseudomonadota bacterium]